MPEDGAKTDFEWIIGPSKLLLERDHFLVARTLYQQRQLEAEIPVELYNPSDEPVQLYARTTLGLLTPIHDLVEEKLETIPMCLKVVSRTTAGKNETVERPEEMEKLVDETRTVITPPQTDQFRQLLVEYRDVFSTQEEPLGSM